MTDEDNTGMNDEDFATSMRSILSYDKDEVIQNIVVLVRKKLEDTQPPNAAEIIQAIEKSNLVHNMMLDWSKRWVATEIGNRLRCGIYDGGAVDRLFESIWTEQFDTAIKDRIKQKVNSAIDAVIKDRLVTIQSK